MSNTATVTVGAPVVPPSDSGYSNDQHTLPDSPPGQIVNWRRREATNPQTNRAFCWVGHDVLYDHAVGTQENVLWYGQTYKKGGAGAAATWVACLESRAPNGDNSRAQYGMEIDLCHDQESNASIGMAVYWGAQTNTFQAGEPTVAQDAIRLAPFRPERNAVRRGISVEGKCLEGALVVGQAPTSETRHAVNCGPGVTLRFSSGDGKAHKSAWQSFKRAYRMDELNVIGCVAFEVDGTTLHWPVLGEPPE